MSDDYTKSVKKGKKNQTERALENERRHYEEDRFWSQSAGREADKEYKNPKPA